MQEPFEQGSTHLNYFASSNSKRFYLEFSRKYGAPQVCVFRSKDEKPTFSSWDVQNQPDEEAENTQAAAHSAPDHCGWVPFDSSRHFCPLCKQLHTALRDQPERKGNCLSCKLSYWTYFWHLLSCSSLDTHFGALFSLERRRSPSVQFSPDLAEPEFRSTCSLARLSQSFLWCV